MQVKRDRLRRLLAFGSTRRVIEFCDAFEKTDVHCRGLISREQFRTILSDLSIPVEEADLEDSWNASEVVLNSIGGYRHCDMPDYRSFQELVPWFKKFSRKNLSVAQKLKKLGLRLRSKCLSLGNSRVKLLATKQIFMQARRKCLSDFRRGRPAPFECKICQRRFVFSYELERHQNRGNIDQGRCPGFYWCKDLPDSYNSHHAPSTDQESS